MIKKISFVNLLFMVLTFISYFITFALIYFAKVEMSWMFYMSISFNVVVTILNIIQLNLGVENTTDKRIIEYNIFVNIILLVVVIYLLNHFILIAFLFAVLMLMLQLTGIIFLIIMIIDIVKR